MHLVTSQTGKCALCAFRASRWGVLRADTSGKRHQGRRARSTPSFTIRRLPSNAHDEADDITKKAEKPISIDNGLRAGTRSVFSRDDVRYSTLAKLMLEQWTLLRHQLSQWHISSAELQSLGIKTKKDCRRWLSEFQLELTRSCAEIVGTNAAPNESNTLIQRLRKAFLTNDVRGLAAALKYSFASFVIDDGFSKEDLESQRNIADLRYPLEWYPEARAMQRKVHLHVGPTNSGKTYQALKRLEAAESGIYAGPLRLLAHEVYTRLNAKGKLCSLVTGEERRVPEGQQAFLSSCTVEMVPLGAAVDVAVIDEIQMMGDVERGWAWTQAFLGVKAKEVHLCGELRTIPLIQDLCAAMGDSLEIHKYERLSPLKAMNNSLKGNLKNLQKGDAIILFSRLAIHAMKKEIEQATGKRCAVVYGSLPPETRAQQANLFNDPNNDYDFLVASDAVGMGLNLSIKRIIFEATSKHDGTKFRTIEISDIKQIAGRAGRYRTAAQAVQNSLAPEPVGATLMYPLQLDIGQKKSPNTVGLVTTLEDFDMPVLQRAMATEVGPLISAGVKPPTDIMVRFAAYFPPQTPFSYILLRLHDISKVNPRFHVCRFKEQLAIADCIQPFDLTTHDRITFIASPANFRDEGMEDVMKALAKCVADQSGGELLDIMEINLELLDEAPDKDGKEYLRKLEALHKALTLYLWLSYRFAGVFRSQALAFHVKSLVEEKIDACLAKVQMDPAKRKMLKALQQRAASLSDISGNETPAVGVAPGKALEEGQVVLPPRWEEELQVGHLDELPSMKESHRMSTVV